MQQDNDEKSNSKKFTHDVFIKRAMSRMEVATEFFDTNLPQHILSKIDLTTLKSEETDFLDNVLGNRTVDMLFSVKTDGQISYINLLLEHQSTSDKKMLLRIVTYMIQICNAYLKKHKKLPLPIIYPIILYTGKKKYTAPRSFWDLFADPELAKQCFAGEVKVLDLREVENIDFTNKIYSGAVLHLMKIIHNENVLPHLEKILPTLTAICQKDFKLVEDMVYYTIENVGVTETESVLNFFKQTTTEEGGNMITIADGLRAEGREIGLQQGREQGREQGLKKGIVIVAKNLLLQGIDVKVISKSTGLTTGEVLKLKQLQTS